MHHHVQGLHRIFAGGGLAGQHHHVRPVIYRIGHVRDLRPGRPGVADHGIQHLGGSDHRFTCHITFADHGFLDMGHLFRRDFYAQIPPGNHNPVAYRDNFIQVFQPFGILNLGNNLHGRTGLLQNPLDLQDSLRGTDKRGGNKVKTFPDPKLDILFVFIRQRRQFNLYVGHIDPFTFPQLAAVNNCADNIRALDFLHFKLNQAVVYEDAVATGYILVKAVVIDMAGPPVPHHIPGGQHIFLPLCQGNFPSALQKPGTDLRAFGIQQSGYRQIQFFPEGF